MAGFNPYAAAGVPTPGFDPGAPSPYAGLYRKGATTGTLQGDPLRNVLGSLFGGRSVAADTSAPAPAPAAGKEQMGPAVPARLAAAPPAPVLPAPVTSPNTRFQAADDTYNQLLSQYGGAPGIQQLAGMTSLPTAFTPTGATQAASLKDYYGAQQLQGSANLGTIINAMGYTGDMEKWAQANPALAQREYAKKFGMNAAGVNPVAGFTMPQQLAGETPAAYQGEPAGQVFSDPKPPVNPMLGYGLDSSLVSVTSPQANFEFKFGNSGNFGTPGTADNPSLAGAANTVPAPPAETQSKTDEFNNRMAATAGLRAKLSPQYSQAFNTPLSFSQYFNPGGQ